MENNLTLITGGAGFIGSNLADNLLKNGQDVRILDNLSRPGTETNLEWLLKRYPNHLQFIKGDIRDFDLVKKATQDVQVIYHFASQVAVTHSVNDPRTDFEINALGTLNVLEGARLSGHQPIIGFTSTNKVYGGLEDLKIDELSDRYALRDFPEGISETRPLDFHSPYGCSKGAADQYVRDYFRIYQLPTFVFRMSCIYGTHQFGVEDQGWVAHFVISTVLNRPIKIYGSGKQVRDILWVGDLIQAFKLATQKIDLTAGQIYNVGGGLANTISIWIEFEKILEGLTGNAIPISYHDWRPGDQLIYVSDTTKISQTLGWKPTINPPQGIEKLFRWVHDNKHLFQG